MPPIPIQMRMEVGLPVTTSGRFSLGRLQDLELASDPILLLLAALQNARGNGYDWRSAEGRVTAAAVRSQWESFQDSRFGCDRDQQLTEFARELLDADVSFEKDAESVIYLRPGNFEARYDICTQCVINELVGRLENGESEDDAADVRNIWRPPGWYDIIPYAAWLVIIVIAIAALLSYVQTYSSTVAS